MLQNTRCDGKKRIVPDSCRNEDVFYCTAAVAVLTSRKKKNLSAISVKSL